MAESIAHDDAAVLDALLIKPPTSPTTAFNRLKQVPGPEPEKNRNRSKKRNERTRKSRSESGDVASSLAE